MNLLLGGVCLSLLSHLRLALAPAPALAVAVTPPAFALTLVLVFALTPAVALAFALALTFALAPNPPYAHEVLKGKDDFGRIGPKVFFNMGCLLNGGSD